jgi:hypothetical protein
MKWKGRAGLKNYESRGRRPRLSSKEEKEENLLFDIIIYDIGMDCLTLTIRLPYVQTSDQQPALRGSCHSRMAES